MVKKMRIIDGNGAAAYVAYAFTEIAAIYPITPSSNMVEAIDEWSKEGIKNIFNQEVKVIEMQSDAGAAGAFHGALQAGALTTTFTASQGLLRMVPNMYKVAGELLPGVFHVSASALAAQASSIYGDHQDVMAVRQTGCALLASGSVQEVADMAPIAHLSAIKGRLPFVHFFDGFRTSHEIQKVEVLEYRDYERLIDTEAIDTFRKNALSPNHPVTRGTTQNPDIYFQTREASNKYYDALPKIVEEYMYEISRITKRNYGLFNYHGDKNAEYIIIAMGSVTETIEETINYLNEKGEKYGLVKVHLYRPFSVEHLLAAIPASVRKICVMDRTKEPGALGEPLYLDVCSAFYESNRKPTIIGGRYGLGSKDVTPTDIKAVFENLKLENAKNNFTVGIKDDVTNKSIESKEEVITASPGTIRCKLWGTSSDGTVDANKEAIKIIGRYTKKHIQGYFEEDLKKTDGTTISHLRFSDKLIKSTYLIDEADYIACHKQSYVKQYNVLKGLKKGGIFVLNSGWSVEELSNNLPADIKRFIAKNEIKFYTIDATKIAVNIGFRNCIDMIMQSAFFKLLDIIPMDEVKKHLNSVIDKKYNAERRTIIKMNYEAVEKGQSELIKVTVPEEWINAINNEIEEDEYEKIYKNMSISNKEREKIEKKLAFIKDINKVIKRQDGNSLPVSAFNTREDGTFLIGTTSHEKCGIALNIPEWDANRCVQCNTCSSICPHASIRPFLINQGDVKSVDPQKFLIKEQLGEEGKRGEDRLNMKGMRYRLQVSPLDCTGCGNCVDMCPVPEKAIKMVPIETQLPLQAEYWEMVTRKKEIGDRIGIAKEKTLKDSQFHMPLMEFSGACAGCGQTPYIKLLTQLFGERMVIANAMGCSAIWGGLAQSIPYCTNSAGYGPVWANSLFENSAEYGYGMVVAAKQIRKKIEVAMKSLVDMSIPEDAMVAFKGWLEAKEDSTKTYEASHNVEFIFRKMELNKKEGKCEFDDKAQKAIKEILKREEHLMKRSHWIVGGDGWAYDSGYGGLDQIVSSGENINVLVLDTEMSSNTGGRVSKATPIGAIAKGALSGNLGSKKDLGMMLMSYGNVYVAQVAIGADREQLIKALHEAEEYDGPSVVICYSSCVKHGVKGGISQSIRSMDMAVKAGYWHLYRYNPENRKNGRKPFVLDSKEPQIEFKEFLLGQERYIKLEEENSQKAYKLFIKAEEDAKYRYRTYKNLEKRN
ncbi:MAG: pyruvate:ferredoxin (flavodoxin) oxidoreductase [Cellulosilyticaceae bacterium]